MTNAILLMAWPYNGQVLTSFRLATDYFMPDVYTGDAKLTQMSSWVNATGYEVVFHCANCLTPGAELPGPVQTSLGAIVLGHAQSSDAPANAACPSEITYQFHNNGYGQWLATLDDVASPQYATWAALKGEVVEGACEP